MTEIANLTATELALAIRAKRYSAREALAEHLDRVQSLNAKINAIVTMNPDAEKDAAAADEVLARGEILGPLHGVPITIKDCFETAGLRTANGYEATANYVPEQDAPTVAKLRAAGAVVIGKTNLPSLAGDFQTDNAVFGRTNNPWNLDTTPGGSSGGESAAVAARISMLGLGSDIGGSIRHPAHCTAVFGIKPTEHLVSTAGYLEGTGWLKAERHLGTVGPLARSIDDLDLGLRIVAGPDRRFLETPPVTLRDRRPRSLRGLRLAYAPEWPGVPTSKVIREALDRLVRQLEAAGAEVTQALPKDVDFEGIREVYSSIFWAEFGGGMSEEEELEQAKAFQLDVNSDEPYLRGAAKAVNISLRDYTKLLVARDRAIVQWETFLDGFDALLCTTSAVPAFFHCPQNAPIEIDGTPYPYATAIGASLEMFDFTGMPGISLPLGITEDSRPFGYQVVGKRWSDIGLLEIAGALAQVSGPSPVPPGFE
jgi:amidase